MQSFHPFHLLRIGKKFFSRLQHETRERLGMGFSAGVTSFQAGENSVLLQTRARAALMQAKAEGGDTIRYVSHDIPAAMNV